MWPHCVYKVLPQLTAGFCNSKACQQNLKALCEGTREEFCLSADMLYLLLEKPSPRAISTCFEHQTSAALNRDEQEGAYMSSVCFKSFK